MRDELTTTSKTMVRQVKPLLTVEILQASDEKLRIPSLTIYFLMDQMV